MATENNSIFALYDGEVVELKGKALNELLAEQNAISEKLALKEAEAKARAIAKAELLDRLGITEDEAKLLLA